MTSWEEHEAGLTAHDIAELRFHWGEAYKITWSDGRFRAERLDGLGHLEAATKAGLRRLIVDDYLKRPVPRTGTAMDDESPQQLDEWRITDDVLTLPPAIDSTQTIPAEEQGSTPDRAAATASPAHASGSGCSVGYIQLPEVDSRPAQDRSGLAARPGACHPNRDGSDQPCEGRTSSGRGRICEPGREVRL